MKLFPLFLAALLGFASPAHAFVVKLDQYGNLAHWDLITLPNTVDTNSVNPITKAIRYYVAADAYSTTNTVAEQNAVRASFDQWQAVPGTTIKFEYAGLAPAGMDVNTSDHTNLVFWTKTTTIVNGGKTDISGVLGITFTSTIAANNTIVEADIVLNGYYYQWFTDLNDPTSTLSNGKLFVEGTAMHEIGHFSGLNHSPVGAATMFVRGDTGPDATQIGLSLDDMSFARFLYPTNSQFPAFGTIKGAVTRSSRGNPVFGASIMAQNAAGNIVAGTVSEIDGTYQLPTLAPGTYLVLTTPLNPSGSSRSLTLGQDIASDYVNAMTDFAPATNLNVIVVANATNTVNFSVTNATQTFFITDIRPVTTNSFPDNLIYSTANAPTVIRLGQSNYLVGVWGPNLPTNNASLTITGDGLTLGPTAFRTIDFGSSNSPLVLNCLSVPINVSSNATPGMRSFIITSNNVTTYANGFIEVLPLIQDYNFDGLDDRFQRKYFSPWTSPQAAPGADPDGDQFTNLEEYIAGTDPTNPASLLKIISTLQNGSGTTVTWQSVPGKTYQVYSRTDFSTSQWAAIGSLVRATNSTAQYLDATATTGARYYKVLVQP